MAVEQHHDLHQKLPRLIDEFWFFGEVGGTTRPQRNETKPSCVHRQQGQSQGPSVACFQKQDNGNFVQSTGVQPHLYPPTAVMAQPPPIHPICCPSASPKMPPRSRNTSMIFGMSMSTLNPVLLEHAQNETDQWNSSSKVYSQSEQKPMNSLPVEELMVMLRFHAQAGQPRSGKHAKQTGSEHQILDLDLAPISEPLPSLTGNAVKQPSLLTMTFQKLHAGLPTNRAVEEVQNLHASPQL